MDQNSAQGFEKGTSFNAVKSLECLTHTINFTDTGATCGHIGTNYTATLCGMSPDVVTITIPHLCLCEDDDRAVVS